MGGPRPGPREEEYAARAAAVRAFLREGLGLETEPGARGSRMAAAMIQVLTAAERAQGVTPPP